MNIPQDPIFALPIVFSEEDKARFKAITKMVKETAKGVPLGHIVMATTSVHAQGATFHDPIVIGDVGGPPNSDFMTMQVLKSRSSRSNACNPGISFAIDWNNMKFEDSSQ